MPIRKKQRLYTQIPWKIMYTVTVRLMFSVDWRNAPAISGMAGKYMFAVRGLCELNLTGL